jgi:DNA-binding transcriptional regulator YiaG
MDSDAHAELDAILNASNQKQTWNNEDRLRLKTFRERLGSPTEIAHGLGISVATLYSWERQEAGENEMRPPPAERQLRKLSRLIAEKHLNSLIKTQETGEAKPGFLNVLVRMRSVQEMMERAALCSRFWVLRTGKPFAAGGDPKTLEMMTRFMKESETELFFVYRELKKGSKEDSRITRAKESYEAISRKLTDHPEGRAVLKRMHPVPIAEEQEAFALGLVDPWISYALAEYSPEGKMQFQRSFDVWMEFIFDVSKDSQFEQKQLVWLELPADEAEKWRAARIELLEKRAS